ncbi:MAG: sulfotransferase domain-containing protein [Candidatus Hodarchaeota archaeon]
MKTIINKLFLKALDTYWINKLPLFISFPRTGSEWLNCAMELYFNRPRLRKNRVTLMPANRTDWMWFHDHDMELKIVHKKVMYLYRDPVQTIYSLIAYNLKNEVQSFFPLTINNIREISEDTIVAYGKCYRDNLIKWILSEKKAKTIISYERMKKSPEIEFQKVCQFFNLPFDKKTMSISFNNIQREQLIKLSDKRKGGGLRKDMLAKQYEVDRKWFIQNWGNVVKQIVVTKKLDLFFNYRNPMSLT